MKLNKFIFAFVVLIFNNNILLSQVYESSDEHNMLFIKNKNKFVLSVKNNDNVDYCDTLAQGLIKKVKNNFYKISSDKNKNIAYKLSFNEELSKINSTEIILNTDGYIFHDDYLLELTIDNGVKNTSYFIEKDRITLPYELKKGYKISLCIFNRGIIVSRDGDVYKGKLYEYIFYDYELQNSFNNISINIDGLNSCYLKQYVINDNIILIDKKSIFWNGIKFNLKTNNGNDNVPN